MFTCEECKDQYTEDESPSDYFCSQTCSNNWTYRISDEVEANDYALDEDARLARHVDGEVSAVEFLTMIMQRRRTGGV